MDLGRERRSKRPVVETHRWSHQYEEAEPDTFGIAVALMAAGAVALVIFSHAPRIGTPAVKTQPLPVTGHKLIDGASCPENKMWLVVQ